MEATEIEKKEPYFDNLLKDDGFLPRLRQSHQLLCRIGYEPSLNAYQKRKPRPSSAAKMRRLPRRARSPRCSGRCFGRMLHYSRDSASGWRRITRRYEAHFERRAGFATPSIWGADCTFM